MRLTTSSLKGRNFKHVLAAGSCLMMYGMWLSVASVHRESAVPPACVVRRPMLDRERFK